MVDITENLSEIYREVDFVLSLNFSIIQKQVQWLDTKDTSNINLLIVIIIILLQLFDYQKLVSNNKHHYDIVIQVMLAYKYLHYFN